MSENISEKKSKFPFGRDLARYKRIKMQTIQDIDDYIKKSGRDPYDFDTQFILVADKEEWLVDNYFLSLLKSSILKCKTEGNKITEKTLWMTGHAYRIVGPCPATTPEKAREYDRDERDKQMKERVEEWKKQREKLKLKYKEPLSEEERANYKAEKVVLDRRFETSKYIGIYEGYRIYELIRKKTSKSNKTFKIYNRKFPLLLKIKEGEEEENYSRGSECFDIMDFLKNPNAKQGIEGKLKDNPELLSKVKKELLKTNQIAIDRGYIKSKYMGIYRGYRIYELIPDEDSEFLSTEFIKIKDDKILDATEKEDSCIMRYFTILYYNGPKIEKLRQKVKEKLKKDPELAKEFKEYKEYRNKIKKNT